MEQTIVEIVQIETTACEAAQAQLRELGDLQLAFVGGGAGDVTLS